METGICKYFKVTVACIYSPSFICIMVYRILLIKESMVRGHTKIPGGECHRHENGYRNETMTFCIYGSIQYKWLIGMDAGRYADNCLACLCAHAQWFSHQNDGADYCDIIEGCHENLMHKREGSIKGEVHLNSRSSAAAVLLSGCLDTHFRISY